MEKCEISNGEHIVNIIIIENTTKLALVLKLIECCARIIAVFFI